MSEQDAKALVDKLKADAEFRRQVHEATTPEEAKQLIQSAGFDVGPDDIPVVQQEAELTGELSDDELQRVVGGLAGPAGAIIRFHF